MKKVYKYFCPVDDSIEIVLPIDAQILKFDTQNKYLCMWALVDTDKTDETRRFRIAGTGHDIDEQLKLEYINTFYFDSLVFHVFEVKI
jgi:hypothetical protein